MIELGKAAREASRALALLSSETKNTALLAIAKAIRHHQNAIQQANQKDLMHAKKQHLAESFLYRLALNEQRITAMANSFEIIAEQPDPIGKILARIQRPNGLEIIRISVHIGVIGVIYESRPNVTADAAALCLKSGNAVILRGGSESFHSSTAIMNAIHEGLKKANIS